MREYAHQGQLEFSMGNLSQNLTGETGCGDAASSTLVTLRPLRTDGGETCHKLFLKGRSIRRK